MKIAFCITSKNRLQHIRETLPKNIADNPGADSAFILLDYNSPDGLGDYIKSNFQSHLESGKLIYFKLKDAPNFLMAHAKNVAHRLGILSGAEVLCNLDADNFTGHGFADYLNEHFTRTANDQQEIFMWSRMIKGEMAKGISGRMCVTKNAFLMTGGYDEKYVTHSPDDKDFNARLRRLGYCAQEISEKYLLAINHNDKMRFKEYPELKGYNYDQFVSPISRVVNNGQIGCGTVFKNFSATPTVIDRIPTRIFGVGCHKTATTSLNAAFKILGYKSGHWENAHWSKTIWNDITGLGNSPLMERYYALCDIPFPVLFEQLDKSYPGSKFILTIRDESDWIASVENHFNPKLNKFVSCWDTDPFTSRIHKIIYGQKTFEKELFLRKYREHNAAVICHFKGRPNDLLVMNMSSGAGWKELCRFLNLPVPKEDYPTRFKTADKRVAK